MDVSQIVSMGFTQEQAQAALGASGGNLSRAIDLLLEQPSQPAPAPAPPPPQRERVLPGTIDVMREWLRLYKTVDGKPENKFGMEERAMGREYTMAVVQETHEFWRKLTSSGQKTV